MEQNVARSIDGDAVRKASQLTRAGLRDGREDIVAEVLRLSYAQIDKLYQLDLGEVQPAIIFNPRRS